MTKTPTAFLSALTLCLLAACSGGGAVTPAGIYTVDKAELRQAMMASMSAEERGNPMASTVLDEAVKGTDFAIELVANGTVNFKLRMYMGPQVDTSGTWKLAGGKLMMTTKDDETGKEATQTVDYANGSFVVEENMGGQKVKMTFRKK
ncbi:MAG TPA: hypothetical protein VF384_04620 [Planctomycetota bacterium]